MRNWNEADEAQWQHLSALSYDDRSVDEELRFKALQAKREIMRYDKQREIEKRGLLYKPAQVVSTLGFICSVIGLGSCLTGSGQQYGGLLVIGVILLSLAGGLFKLNDRLSS